MILGHVYKTLYNIGMRRRAEQETPEVKAVLEKRERSDVRQDETLLTRLEREIVMEWEGKLQKITALEMRVEETLFVLKDLGVLGIDEDWLEIYTLDPPKDIEFVFDGHSERFLGQQPYHKMEKPESVLYIAALSQQEY